MTNFWFKFYGGEYLGDPKMAALTPQERSCWLTILCLASIATTQGKIDFLTVEVLLSRSGIVFDPYNPEEWNNNLGVLKKFENMKMLKLNEDGSILVKNWEKRQEHNLTVAERVAKHRLNKGNVTNDVTNVTTEKNRVEKNRINTTEIRISDSSNLDESKTYEIELDEGYVPKKKRDPFVESAAKVWHKKCREEYGREPSGGLTKAMKIIGEARKKLTDDQIKEKMMSWFDEEKLEEHEMMQITHCFSPFQIDKYLSSL